MVRPSRPYAYCCASAAVVVRTSIIVSLLLLYTWYEVNVHDDVERMPSPCFMYYCCCDMYTIQTSDDTRRNAMCRWLYSYCCTTVVILARGRCCRGILQNVLVLLRTAVLTVGCRLRRCDGTHLYCCSAAVVIGRGLFMYRLALLHVLLPAL